MEKNILLGKEEKNVKKNILLKRVLLILKKKFMKRNINSNGNKSVVVNNNVENNDKKRVIRNPGIDFVRILSMYAIIFHNILYHADLFNKYHKYKKLILLNTSCFWHVNSFILISGYVGYKSNKISNLLYLWLDVLFYSLGITFFYGKYISNTNAEKITFEDYLPVYFEKYWYFTKYFGMYFFLPLINKGIASLTKSELRNISICLILVYVVMKDVINPKIDIYTMNNGYSVLWFQIYYITGAYLGKYKNEYNGTKKIVFCIIYLFVFYYSTILCFNISDYSLDNSKGYFKTKIMIILKRLFVLRISSLPMILQSISIVLLFTQIKYNQYFTKIITFLGPFTFGIYLIHINPIFKNNIIKQLFQKESNYLTCSIVVKLVLIRSFEIFGFCLIIDYFRNILFIFFRLRKICILIERIIYKLI